MYEADVGHVVVAEDVLPVQRDAYFCARLAHQARRRVVHRLGYQVPGRQKPSCSMPDGLGVDVPIAGVPADVLVSTCWGDMPSEERTV